MPNRPEDLNINRYYMILNSIHEIIITRHAANRAYQNDITSDMIEATINGGKIIRFGKNNLKFIK